MLPGKNDICLSKNKIINDKESYDLIKDSDLVKLDKQDEIIWTGQHITEYVKNNPSISSIYYTRKSSKPFNRIFELMETELADRNIKIKYLFTPSGQGLKGSPRNKELMKQWLHGTLEGYDSLEVEWLLKKKLVHPTG